MSSGMEDRTIIVLAVVGCLTAIALAYLLTLRQADTVLFAVIAVLGGVVGVDMWSRKTAETSDGK
ncbi:MAG: hypothetical protein QW230_00805 [Thermofilum sp.]